MWLRELLTHLPGPKAQRRGGRGLRRIESRLAEPRLAFRSVPERFVQDIWGGALYDRWRLTTVDGEQVRVLDPGIHNRDGGPDFTCAQVEIGGVLWRGDVEIHVRSSDWIAHKHEGDPAYNSVVLHVALSADIWTGRLRRPDGTPLPELILLPFLGQPVHRLLRRLRVNEPDAEITCAEQLKSVPADLVDAWIQKLGLERLDERSERMRKRMRADGSYEAVLSEVVFEGLGYAKNTDQMRTLARRTPLTEVRKLEKQDREAVLFAIAGLLPTRPSDPDSQCPRYGLTLAATFQGLVARNPALARVPQMRRVQWAFFRLRPANFPTLRIAQAAALLDQGAILGPKGLDLALDSVAAPNPLAALRELFVAEPGEYWRSHVRLDRAGTERSPAIGKQRIDRIVTNGILPILLSIGTDSSDSALIRRVHHVYEKLRPESDEIVRSFRAYGVRAKSCVASQGVHQLYRTRCSTGGCLSCAIGRHILTQTRTPAAEP